MLSSFKIRNFKSILDMKVDFGYNEKRAPSNYGTLPVLPFLKAGKKDRFIPVLALFGANASGKSNVIEAMENWHVLTSGANPSQLFHPNKLNRKYNSTAFEVEFFIKDDKFTYFIDYDGTQIRSEKLLKNNKISYHIELPNIFNMSGIITGSYSESWFKDFFNIELVRKDNSGKQKQSTAFLGRSIQRFPGIVDLALVASFMQDIRILPSLEITTPPQHAGAVPLEEITSFVKKLDIDIANIIKKKPDQRAQLLAFNPQNIDHFIKTIHKDIEGKDIEFDLAREESLGTNILFCITEAVLWALQKGITLVIDELDRSLHPLLLAKIIELFKDKNYNTKNAQLVFTCHSTDILENQTLKRSEIAIITKNLKEGTILRRLLEFEGIRNTYNFRKMYLDGRFGGIPYPYI